MIIHPDGRIEGAPEELVAYQKAAQAASAPKKVPDSIKHPSIAAEWMLRPSEILCGEVVYVGPIVTAQN